MGIPRLLNKQIQYLVPMYANKRATIIKNLQRAKHRVQRITVFNFGTWYERLLNVQDDPRYEKDKWNTLAEHKAVFSFACTYVVHRQTEQTCFEQKKAPQQNEEPKPKQVRGRDLKALRY